MLCTPSDPGSSGYSKPVSTSDFLAIITTTFIDTTATPQITERYYRFAIVP